MSASQLPQKIYEIALHHIDGVGGGIAKMLLSYCGSAEAVFKTPKPKLLKIPGIGHKTANTIHSFKNFDKAEQIYEQCEQKSIRILSFQDEEFPYRLKQIYDAPLILYCQGHFNLNSSRIINIVGTRFSTDYGKSFLEQFIREIAPFDPVIVSGLAYGIDIYAHRKALDHDLSTIGVLANGLDSIYPSEHIGIAHKMQEKGGIISEKPPGTKAEAYFFPARNRIIAGLSDATVVVEAGDKGGALITAEYAWSYDRDIFALPGNIYQMRSIGCNKLIKDNKASLLTSASDIVYYLNWNPDNNTTKAPPEPPHKNPDLPELTPEEKQVIELFSSQDIALQLDEIAWKSQLPVNQLASLIINLEFKGVIKTLPGQKYRLATSLN